MLHKSDINDCYFCRLITCGTSSNLDSVWGLLIILLQSVSYVSKIHRVNRKRLLKNCKLLSLSFKESQREGDNNSLLCNRPNFISGAFLGAFLFTIATLCKLVVKFISSKCSHLVKITVLVIPEKILMVRRINITQENLASVLLILDL